MKPLLAHTIEDTSKINYPVLVSVKLDGVRCLIIDGVAMSRSLKPIRNEYVQSCIGRPEYNGLDGELIVGDVFAQDCYRATSSGIMAKDGKPDFKFHVFDRWDLPDEYMARRALLETSEHIVVVPHMQALTEADLLRIEQSVLERGGEGVMVRSFNGKYKHGRSTMKEGILGKLKRMESSEAEILSVVEMERNLNEPVTNAIGHTERSSHQENKVPAGVMGALQVRCLKTDAVFQIGTGFNAEDRLWFWLNQEDVIGQIVTYNHFPVGRKDLPRHPSYKGFRLREDM
jgi:DNA ligase-1